MDNILPIFLILLTILAVVLFWYWIRHKRQQHKYKRMVTPKEVQENLYPEQPKAEKIPQPLVTRDEKGRFVSLKQQKG